MKKKKLKKVNKDKKLLKKLCKAAWNAVYYVQTKGCPFPGVDPGDSKSIKKLQSLIFNIEDYLDEKGR